MASGIECRLDVLYIPTPEKVVAHMLRLAQVGRNDLLYDLGSGDGRVVIAAARKFGAAGVGVDLNPRRIEESNEKAVLLGIRDRVRFVARNLFDVHIRKATVVLLSLNETVNMKLRPRLLGELKPGTRIVSHDFGMGDWSPDRESEIDGHFLYYWIVPANAAGTWKLTVRGRGPKEHRYLLRITQRFQNAGGSLESADEETTLTGVKLKGDEIRFAVKEGRERHMPLQFRGRIAGNTIRGIVLQGDAKRGGIVWTARRDRSTIRPLDAGPDLTER